MNDPRPRLRRIIDDFALEMRNPQRGPGPRPGPGRRRRGPPLPLVPQLPRPDRLRDPRMRIRATAFRRYLLMVVGIVVPQPQPQLCPALTTETILTAYNNSVFTQLYTHCILSPSSSSSSGFASCVLPPSITPPTTAAIENTTTHLFHTIARHLTLSNTLLASQLRTWDALRDLSARKDLDDRDVDRDDLPGMWPDYPFPLPGYNHPPSYALQPVQTLFRRRFLEMVALLDKELTGVARAAVAVIEANMKAGTRGIFNVDSDSDADSKSDSDADSKGRSFFARLIPRINVNKEKGHPNKNNASPSSSPHNPSYHNLLPLTTLLTTHLSTASTLDLAAYTLTTSAYTCTTILSSLFTSFASAMYVQRIHERQHGGPRLDALWAANESKTWLPPRFLPANAFVP
ncbi:hypothetical protein LZ554_009595 [Drepanopeziza brunnea f. sp. 'monogermtubi']|nr:hypothetical protein LZ554_009595 [Drepanopeziza brunnea f. sp. 'monogermtubi']